MKPLEQLLSRFPVLVPLETELHRTFAILRSSFAAGGKLLICGNGGSAADAEHIVGELMKDFCVRRTVPNGLREKLADDPMLAEGLRGALPAISLCSQTALLTALANDGDPSLIFAQQVYGYGRTGDVLLALSTSGNSANVVRAAKVAKAVGMQVVSVTGQGGGKLASLADAALCLPDTETYRVQELTMPIYHALCLALEEEFFQ